MAKGQAELKSNFHQREPQDVGHVEFIALDPEKVVVPDLVNLESSGDFDLAKKLPIRREHHPVRRRVRYGLVLGEPDATAGIDLNGTESGSQVRQRKILKESLDLSRSFWRRGIG